MPDFSLDMIIDNLTAYANRRRSILKTFNVVAPTAYSAYICHCLRCEKAAKSAHLQCTFNTEEMSDVFVRARIPNRTLPI